MEKPDTGKESRDWREVENSQPEVGEMLRKGNFEVIAELRSTRSILRAEESGWVGNIFESMIGRNFRGDKFL